MPFMQHSTNIAPWTKAAGITLPAGSVETTLPGQRVEAPANMGTYMSTQYPSQATNKENPYVQHIPLAAALGGLGIMSAGLFSNKNRKRRMLAAGLGLPAAYLSYMAARRNGYLGTPNNNTGVLDKVDSTADWLNTKIVDGAHSLGLGYDTSNPAK